MTYQLFVKRKGTSAIFQDFRRYPGLTPKVGDEITCHLDNKPTRAKVTKVAEGMRDYTGGLVDHVNVDEIGPA